MQLAPSRLLGRDGPSVLGGGPLERGLIVRVVGDLSCAELAVMGGPAGRFQQQDLLV